MALLTKPQPPVIPHFVVSLGTKALGDSIARLSVIPQLFTDAPHILQVHVLVADYLMDFAKHALKLYPVTIHEIDKPLPNYLDGSLVFNFLNENLTALRIGLLEHAHLLLLQRELDPKCYYLSVPPKKPSMPLGLPEQYVVAAFDFTSTTRVLPMNVLYEVATGLQLPIVLLGNTRNVAHTHSQQLFYNENIIDFRNQTTIDESHAIITNARAIFGLDNGVLHLAATTATPIVAAYSSVSPAIRVPKRLNGKTIVIEPTNDCRYCQSATHYYQGHDYRNCAIVYPACVKTLTSDRFIKALKEILNGSN